MIFKYLKNEDTRLNAPGPPLKKKQKMARKKIVKKIALTP